SSLTPYKDEPRTQLRAQGSKQRTLSRRSSRIRGRTAVTTGRSRSPKPGENYKPTLATAASDPAIDRNWYYVSVKMTFKPEAFRELTNWIFLAIGVVLTVLLPRLVRGLKRLFSKEVPEIPSRPSTIYDSGTVTARGA